MESQLAKLHTIFVGKPYLIDALADYGDENGIFKDRVSAVAKASERYFQKSPDQQLEGEVTRILTIARELSIERHRIAHGIVQPIRTTSPPDNDGWVSLDRSVHYLSAPWYATKKLRMTWIHVASHGIDVFAQQFSELAQQIAKLNETLVPSGGPLPFEIRFRVADNQRGDAPGRALD